MTTQNKLQVRIRIVMELVLEPLSTVSGEFGTAVQRFDNWFNLPTFEGL